MSTTQIPSATPSKYDPNRPSTLSAGARAGMSTGIIIVALGFIYGLYIWNERLVPFLQFIFNSTKVYLI